MAKDKIIHIFDDEKFIDGAIDLFELDQNLHHKYVVITPTPEKLKYVTSNKVITIRYDRSSYIEDIKTILDEHNIGIVAVHALNQIKWKLINNLDKTYTTVWFIFGYDLYNNWKPFYQNLFESETKVFENRLKSKKLLLLENSVRQPFIYKFLTKIPFKKLVGSKNRFINILKSNHPNTFYEAVKRIDFVAPIVKSEMQLIKKVNPKLSYLPFTYNSLEKFSKGITTMLDKEASNILVGNSASSTNNHLEVFIKLSKVDLGKRKVIVPLSYGDETYRAFILGKGKEYLKDNFVPILDFMPLEEYNSILAGCGIAIFNHIRQQALGNVMVMVKLGAKVFINEKSPIFSEFNQAGLYIFSSKTITNDEISSPLSENERIHNVHKITDLYGHTTVVTKLNQLTLTLSKL